MTTPDPPDPDDLAAIRADDQLVEDLIAGQVRDGEDVERLLTEWRDRCQRS